MEVCHWKTLVWSCRRQSCRRQSCCFREVKMDHYKSYNSKCSCSQESGQWLFLDPFPTFLYPRNMLHITSFRWDVIEIPMYPTSSTPYINALIWFSPWHSLGFPGGSVAKNQPTIQESQKMQIESLGCKDPWRRAWQPTPVFLPGESHE